LVLNEQGELFVVNVRRSCGVGGRAGQSRGLQVEKQRTGGRAGVGAGAADVHPRAVGASPRIRPEARPQRSRRGVAQEAGDAVEDITAFKEAAEDLRVVAVRPIASRLDRVVAGDDREVVAYLEALEEFVDLRRQEEWVAEAERRIE